MDDFNIDQEIQQDINMLDPNNDEKELEEMRARVQEMEKDAEKLREMQANPSIADHEKEEVDSRSIYVGNVDYSVTPEELQAHFDSCGSINRVTILCDKWTGHPKGYAYVEFTEPSLINNALTLNESILRGRALKVIAKRTNLPGVTRGRGRGRGRPMMRGFGGHVAGFRGRPRYGMRRPYFAPY